MQHSVAIIGGGCAGLTAAIYCARGELSPLIFTGDSEEKGGLLVKTSVVENYPGLDNVLGYDIVTKMEEQAVRHGAVVIEKKIVEIDLQNDVKKLVDESGNVYYVKAVIVATGSTPNKLGLKDEDKYWGKGISSCATCDGALYKKKRIMVIGGGDSAMEEASFLTKFSKVTLVHRGSTFRASKAMQTKVLSNPNIEIIYNHTVKSFNSSFNGDFLQNVSLISNNGEENNEKEYQVDGLFYGLGLKPNTNLFNGVLKMDSENYIVAGENLHLMTETSVKGVFVAGDCHDKIYRQAIVASGDGCRAAMDAMKFLS